MIAKKPANVEFLETLLKVEKAKTIDELFKTAQLYDAEVIQSSSKITILKCDNAKYFEVGDVIGYVAEDSPKNLGVIRDIYKDTLIITPYTSIPDDRIKVFHSESLIGYDLQINLLEKIRTGNLDPLERMASEVIFGIKDMPDIATSKTIEDPSLDKFQRRAVERILNLDSGEILLIVGPPGTGKTRVIANAAIRLASVGERVLIASHTNLAVDNALEKIPPQISVRIGLPEKTNLKEHLLDTKVKLKLGDKLQDIQQSIIEVKKMLWRFLKLGMYTRASELREELLDLYKEKEKLVRDAEDYILCDTNIVGTTLIKSNLHPLSDHTFDVVFIDESSQASIPLALLGMIKARKYVLVGDHHQLMPVFKVKVDSEKYSAFIYLKNLYPHRVCWLKYHYRSNYKIAKLMSFFYEEEILPAEVCKYIHLDINTNGLLSPEKPVVFLNVNGEEEKTDDGSKINRAEVEACKIVIRELIVHGIQSNNIACIAPYRAQVELLKKEFARYPLYKVEFGTVDSFQGREKDVVIFSVTATSDFYFAANSNRLNVAFSRAKKKLIVIGNAESIMRRGKILKKLLRFCSKDDAIFTIIHKDRIVPFTRLKLLLHTPENLNINRKNPEFLTNDKTLENIDDVPPQGTVVRRSNKSKTASNPPGGRGCTPKIIS